MKGVKKPFYICINLEEGNKDQDKTVLAQRYSRTAS